MKEIDKILKKAKKILQETDVEEFELKQGKISISIKRYIKQKKETKSKQQPEKKISTLTTNKVGKVKFVSIQKNREVKIGDIVCYIESLGITHEIRSQVNGKIIKYLVKDNAFVEYGVPLVEIEEK